MRYVQGIQPNVPAHTTFIEIFMNVPTCPVAHNVHGPCFTTPTIWVDCCPAFSNTTPFTYCCNSCNLKGKHTQLQNGLLTKPWTVTGQSLIFRHFYQSFISEDVNKNSVFRCYLKLKNWIRFSPLTKGQLKVIRKKCYRNTPKFSHPSAPKYHKTKALRGSIQPN